MKKLMFAVLVCGITACTTTMTPQSYPRMITTSAIDLRPYTESGFLFTHGSYPYAYEAVGYINCLAVPEEDYELVKWERTGKRDKNDFEDIYYHPDINTQENSNYYKLALNKHGRPAFKHTLIEPMQPTVLIISEIIDPQELYDSIYQRCVSMGADAFVEFKRTQFDMPLNNKSSINTKWHQLEGYAIRRLYDK